jgi:predicted NAD-dependent protein-ADP-ribosyltransferase YbiA (DUF1768 family)
VPIVVSSPAEGPYACLHPDCQHGFRAGLFWSSVSRFCLADRVAAEEDRERLRIRARDPAHARELLARMVEAEGWRARAPAVLRLALLASFEQNLADRAILIATGAEPIAAEVDDALPGLPDGDFGRALAEVRAIVRRRAEDPDAIQCAHQTPDEVGRACVHLVDRMGSLHHHRRFTGQGRDHDLLCPACFAALPAAAPLRKLCADCFADMHQGARGADAGAPAFRERPTALRFEHRVAPLAALADETLALADVARAPFTWLLLDRSGRIHRVDLARAAAEAGGTVAQGAIDLAGPLVFRAAPDGRLAVVGEARGRRAVVLEPATGRTTMSILRDDYHPEHCRFPLGFFELGGRLLLVHATAWNRLDVSDPATGELLTSRGPTSYQSGEAQPDHYLDYFHAGLLVSPLVIASDQRGGQLPKVPKRSSGCGLPAPTAPMSVFRVPPVSSAGSPWSMSGLPAAGVYMPR